MLKTSPYRALTLFRTRVAASKMPRVDSEIEVQAKRAHHAPYAELSDLFFRHEVVNAEIPGNESLNIPRIAPE